MSEQQSGVTIAEALVEATFVLRQTGVPEGRRDAGSLLMHALKRDMAFLITHSDERIAAGELALFRRSVARRAAGEPLQYITGRPHTKTLPSTSSSQTRPTSPKQTSKDSSAKFANTSRASRSRPAATASELFVAS
ncbi:MAG: hypothetical protein LC754_17350 [Acidobacteria bacterium]|nr:hypothetical protein [Acidobacteriota bacterium]